MHTSSNEVPSQNQLAMGGVAHKLICMLKPFDFINVGQHPLLFSLNFINVGQYPLSYSNTAPQVWATNKAQHVYTILIKQGL